MSSATTESCSSRSFSWLMKSCFPNPQQQQPSTTPSLVPTSAKFAQENPSYTHNDYEKTTTTLSSLPDDLLLECLSKLPSSSFSEISLVSRKWSTLLSSSSFYDLRRSRGHLQRTLLAVSAADSGVYAANHRIGYETRWEISPFRGIEDVSPQLLEGNGSFSHVRLVPIGKCIYMLGRNGTVVRYDIWTRCFASRSPMLYTRKKFAAASIGGKIYVSGGAARTLSVDEYDPETDTWKIVAESSRRRYGCIGAGVDGVFYVIGGLKIGCRAEMAREGRVEPHVYACSMDLYDVEARAWLRSRTVPGGGCVVAACAAGAHVYVLASHAVELSFWRYDGRRKSGGGGGGGGGGGEWCRMKSPPLPAQVRLETSVRFSCVGVGENVVLVQVLGCIDDLLRRSGRSVRGLKEGLVLLYDSEVGEWSRVADLPEIIRRPACVCVEC